MREPTRRSRGYLPHFDDGTSTQFITWRLADALEPEWWLEQKSRAFQMTEDDGRKFLRQQVELMMDQGKGSAILADPANAAIVQKCLLHGHRLEHTLHSFVIMPNHVHVLLTPINEIPIREIVRKIKLFSSLEINHKSASKGKLWQPEYFDRMIRSEDHFIKTEKYIEWNPVKAGLVGDPAIYRWSTANPNVGKLLD